MQPGHLELYQIYVLSSRLADGGAARKLYCSLSLRSAPPPALLRMQGWAANKAAGPVREQVDGRCQHTTGGAAGLAGHLHQ
jgi:hypothetical protein